MSEIDWSKAPDDADGACKNGWIKKTGRERKSWSWMPFESRDFFSNDKWYPTMTRFGHDLWGDFIPRPTNQEWEGGLPQEGSKVEVEDYRYGWIVGAVMAHDKDEQLLVCRTEYGYDGYSAYRPLKSQQERQREELANVILETDFVGEAFMYKLADAILSRYNLEPKP